MLLFERSLTRVLISTNIFIYFILIDANHARIYGVENLHEALEERSAETPLITITNHHSCMDEPLIHGI